MAIKLRPDSAQEVLKKIRKRVSLTRKETNPALLKTLAFIQGEAIPRTPIDTGNLRNGYDISVVQKGETYVGRIQIPKEAVNYAVPVHEVTTNKHAIGESKFLINTINDNIDNIRRRLKDDLKV